jgi:hypothetical protein
LNAEAIGEGFSTQFKGSIRVWCARQRRIKTAVTLDRHLHH